MAFPPYVAWTATTQCTYINSCTSCVSSSPYVAWTVTTHCTYIHSCTSCVSSSPYVAWTVTTQCTYIHSCTSCVSSSPYVAWTVTTQCTYIHSCTSCVSSSPYVAWTVTTQCTYIHSCTSCVSSSPYVAWTVTTQCTYIHSCTSCVSSSPVVITCQSTTDYNSSVRACRAIFSPDPPRVASLPTSQEFWAAQETGSALQKWIVHHKTLTSRFRPELVKCEGEKAVWSDVAVTPARVLVPIESQHIVFDSLDQLTHPSVKAGMTLIKRSYWWQGIGSGVSKWTKACEACQKRLK